MIFIVPLIAYVIAVFLTLWVADIYFTTKVTARLGSAVEINPLIKFILQKKGKYLAIFKIVEITLFGAGAYLVVVQEGQLLLYALFMLIILYAILVAQGISIYSQIYKKSMPGVILFVLFVAYTLFFIDLTYAMFSNNAALSRGITNCNNEYVKVYSACKGAAPQKQFDANFDLNLFVPGGQQ